jgi:DNA-binding SARP family transcriptional activator
MALIDSAPPVQFPLSRTGVEVEVAVLGPVEIRGAAQAFCRSAARELVVYLVFHASGVRNEEWAVALWPDRSVAMSTVHSTASVARRALGPSGSGTDHLPRSGRRLRLADTVGTDVDRFMRWAADPDPVGCREALALVRGRPFEGLGLADWAVLEGIQAELEDMVVTTALRGAGHALGAGQVHEAEWMLRRGLRASPYDERLWLELGALTRSREERATAHEMSWRGREIP